MIQGGKEQQDPLTLPLALSPYLFESDTSWCRFRAPSAAELQAGQSLTRNRIDHWGT